MRRFMLASIAPLLAWLTILPASACIITSERVAPSNFELVQMADAVGVYRAVSGSARAGLAFGKVVFRLERSVRGAPPRGLTLNFAQLFEADEVDSESPESPFEFHNYGAGCPTGGFNRGGQYLLILNRDEEGKWDRVYDGGSRDHETYGGESSAWARTVRRYAALKGLDAPAQQAALTAFRDEGRDPDGTPLSPLEREDIRNHLRTPSQWKPTSWLVERYETAMRGEPVDLVLSGPINSPWELGPDPRATLLTSLSWGPHPDAQPLFERLLAMPGLPGRERGLVLRYFARHGQYARAFQWMERQLLAELPLLPSRDALALIRLVGWVQRGEDDPLGQERWRSDPRALAAWPELEIAVDRYEERLQKEERSR